MQVPDRFYRKFANADLKLRARNPAQEDVAFTRAALAMCENIDWNVGRVLDRLDELKLADNTIVIYFSDNGPNSWRWNGGMKGRKGSTDEGGVRAPFLIRWPGHIAAGRAHAADCRRHRPAAHAGRPGRHPDRQHQAAGRHQPQAAAPGRRQRLAGPHDLLPLERQGQRAHAALPPR